MYNFFPKYFLIIFKYFFNILPVKWSGFYLFLYIIFYELYGKENNNNFHNFIFRFVNNILRFVKIKINLTTSAIVKNNENNNKKNDSGTMAIL